MPMTKSGLVAARIYEVDDSGNPKGGLAVSFMFNPKEYSVTQQNSYSKAETGDANAKVELSSAGYQKLTLKQLVFDTYDLGTDVTLITKLLWDLMKPVPPEGGGDDAKPTARYVAFEWGSFRFVSVITSVTQNFTLFTQEGVPVRAMVDVSFEQFTNRDNWPGQNPTSGGGPLERVWRVKAGDRLDYISADVYGDATLWRNIAEYNKIEDPFRLRPGSELSIPPQD
ncbi:MAG: LysM peptidoglycan-binding domain-containing protein [Anaerolineales bacterium]|nr:LysM peptidoglycan-binding domain-containing protein [Anaerolineales bacterium]MCB8961477.1 LysM peptidoglycan-binding domain-containing protein [Ardenticatenales bacterium]